MRAVLAALLAVLVLTAGPQAQSASTKSVLSLAQAYLRHWEPALAAIVAEEQYTQDLAEFTRSGINRQTKRELVSDVLLVQAPNDPVWMLFRDVLAVDSQPVRDRQRRFDALFARPNDVVASARRIADESARYNLGSMARDLNTPAAALLFLKEPFSDSSSWERPTTVDLEGMEAWRLAFRQHRSPFVIRTRDGSPQPAAGEIWIEHATGRIVRTALDIWTVPGRTARRPPKGHVQVVSHFGAVPGLDVWVPVRMEETYQLFATSGNAMIERLDARAIYSNHRRFQTAARVIG